jgi:tryptophan synthase beta chain
VTDTEALRGAKILAREEGIIPALESAHAVAYLEKMTLEPTDRVVVIVSGRGDKDMTTYIEAFGEGISDAS